MSTSLYFDMVTKKPFVFKHPIKGMIAERYYDHDGSLSGYEIILTPEKDLDFFEGMLAAGPTSDKKQNAEFEKIVQHLRDGLYIEMWIDE